MPKLSTEEYKRLLKSRRYENIQVINVIETFLKKKRGYVVRIPKKGTDVIHLVSGGIDSIVTWAMLMEQYGLRVHPVSIKTGQKRHQYELKSLQFYSQLFKKKYPKLFVEPFEITYLSSPPEIAERMRNDLINNVHPDILKNNFDPETNSIHLTRKFLFPAFVPFPAARVALFFEMQRNLKIRTISMSVLPTDGIYNESQTLTAIRGAMFGLCTFTNDYRWQIFSLCFEKELKQILTKSDLIKWAKAHRIPLEHTYSCFMATPNNCGGCVACGVRKDAFKEAGVQDPTIYEENIHTFTNFASRNLEDVRKAASKFIGLKLRRKPRVMIKDYTY